MISNPLSLHLYSWQWDGERRGIIAAFARRSRVRIACFFPNPVVLQGECNKANCPFKHSRPSDNAPECPWYNRGFCKKGPHCKLKHAKKKKKCVDYADFGFCVKGPECKFGHPNFDKPMHTGNGPVIGNRGSGMNPSGYGDHGGGRGGFRGGRGGGRGRGGGGGHGPPWECPQCQNSNYNFRTECNRCGIPRPGGS